jgi:predicted Ser/Thr protein kinase
VECLDANAVQDLMAGALDNAARALAIAHLDGCSDCRDLISLLARDATRDAAVDILRDTGERLAAGRPEGTEGIDATAGTEGIGATATAGTADTAPDAFATKASLPPRSRSGGDPALMATDAPADLLAAKRVRTPSMAGRILDRYTLVERLGAGAMGVVYRADHHGLGRQVALKLLHRPDDSLTDRLVREARSMAQVNHPNVVAVYDVAVADGTTYIAMELVEGVSLRYWQQQPHTVAEIVEAYIAAGRGLAAAHAAGIVHRDFKPDNCLVGADGRIRVTDFGLAAARASETPRSDDIELTASGLVLGTPAYMAPEQFSGGNLDPRTDQFNFCVALYEALYGSRPFAGKSFEELGTNVREGRLRPAPAGSRVSGALRAIIVRGLCPRPGDRFPTMDHLLAQLGRDRARPWRATALAATALAAALGLGLVADLVVRDRVTAEIHESFLQTGRQTMRAWEGLTGRFDTSANQVYSLSVMREVSSNRDQADFGLGDAQTDAENLDRIQNELSSQDWTLVQNFAGTQYVMTIAVADYKGRMMYSSAAPDHSRSDLTQLAWVKNALTEKDRSITLVRTDDPALVATGLLGPKPPPGLGFLYTRTLVLGNDTNKEVASAFIQAVDAAKLFGEIRLDDRTMLSIVAPDHTAIGDLSDQLVASAETADGTAEAELDGALFQVLAQPIRGFDGQIVGNVIMARQLDSVLLSLFPGARLMFALAMIAAIGVAAIAALRMRRITRA